MAVAIHDCQRCVPAIKLSLTLVLKKKKLRYYLFAGFVKCTVKLDERRPLCVHFSVLNGSALGEQDRGICALPNVKEQS